MKKCLTDNVHLKYSLYYGYLYLCHHLLENANKILKDMSCF